MYITGHDLSDTRDMIMEFSNVNISFILKYFQRDATLHSLKFMFKPFIDMTSLNNNQLTHSQYNIY